MGPGIIISTDGFSIMKMQKLKEALQTFGLYEEMFEYDESLMPVFLTESELSIMSRSLELFKQANNVLGFDVANVLNKEEIETINKLQKGDFEY